jgi:pyrroline-5-carboxylate reductase
MVSDPGLGSMERGGSVASMSTRLLVVGGGRMGSALVRGLLGAGWNRGAVSIAEARPERRGELADELPGVAVAADVSGADGAVVAVKPADAEAACRALAEQAVGRVLSIMAGVTIGRLESWLGPQIVVLRAMPNTPATIGAGMSAVSAGSRAGEGDLAWAEEILGSVGRVVRLPEASLDAVTGLAGSGPAYVFLVAEALIAAGVEAGLTPETSRLLTIQTLAGSAQLLAQSGEAPESLRAQVTSPGGTTEAGVETLERRGIRAAFAEAVTRATERSRELGR